MDGRPIQTFPDLSIFRTPNTVNFDYYRLFSFLGLLAHSFIERFNRCVRGPSNYGQIYSLCSDLFAKPKSTLQYIN